MAAFADAPAALGGEPAQLGDPQGVRLRQRLLQLPATVRITGPSGRSLRPVRAIAAQQSDRACGLVVELHERDDPPWLGAVRLLRRRSGSVVPHFTTPHPVRPSLEERQDE